MKRILLFALALIFSVLTSVVGQHSTSTPPSSTQPAASPAPQQQPDVSSSDEVVRVTTNLVQVDAVVTDKDGRHVTGLHAEDFEILEDGRPQQVTNFSYVSPNLSAPAQPTTPVAMAQDDRRAPVPPATSVRLRPEQVRRTIALVVDDLGLSPESLSYVRRALRAFVDEQMQPNDLISIVRTGSGVGALQSFTVDRQQLYAAIERVRWSSSNSGISALAPIFLPEFTIPADSDGPREDFGFRRDTFTVGTLNTLSQVVNGLRQLPGRKSLVFFSEGFPLITRDRGGGGRGGRFELRNRVADAIERLVDAANRASVVFYSIDARGVPMLTLTAADELATVMRIEGAPGVRRRLGNRGTDFADSQESLNYLAQSTGGLFIRNNDLGQAVRRALSDQQGYYLIGYRPAESSVDPATGRRGFHEITVRVKHPGLRVRSRSGFLGGVGEDARPVRRTRAEQLSAALASPFATGGVRLRLTPVFGNDERTGSFIRLLLYIDARDFSFIEEAGGWHKATMDVMAITVGDNERVADQVNRTETIRVRGETRQLLLRDGLIYFYNIPVKRAGNYQLRVAVRDAASERVGAASQFIAVPDLGNNRLSLSSLVINGSAPTQANGAHGGGAPAPLPSAAQDTSRSNGIIEEINAQASSAVRHFRRGMTLDYGYVIYNARVERTTRRPRLTTQVRLFHGSQQVFAGQPAPFNVGQQTDMKRLKISGRLQLGTTLQPGEYMLQVVVTDSFTEEERRTAMQWVDFEIQ